MFIHFNYSIMDTVSRAIWVSKKKDWWYPRFVEWNHRLGRLIFLLDVFKFILLFSVVSATRATFYVQFRHSTIFQAAQGKRNLQNRYLL